jgi:hypothetical protein
MGLIAALLVLAACREASIFETSEGEVAALIETDEVTRDVSAEKIFRGVQANTDMLNKLHKLLKTKNELDRKFVLAFEEREGNGHVLEDAKDNLPQNLYSTSLASSEASDLKEAPLSSNPISPLYPPQFSPYDRNWTAEDVLDFADAARAPIVLKFYLYDYGLDSLDNIQSCMEQDYKRYSYSGDIYFLQQLRGHRWRTLDEDNADLFIVPSVNSPAARGWCNADAHQKDVHQKVKKTKTWQARPHDHVLCASDWKQNDLLEGAQVIHFEAQEDHQISGPYVNHLNELIDEQLYLSQRPIRYFFGGQTQDRIGYKIRRQMMDELAGKLDKSIFAQRPPSVPSGRLMSRIFKQEPRMNAPKCPENGARWEQSIAHGPGEHWSMVCTGFYNATLMLQSELVLYPRGDTPSTRRVVDAMEFGAIPVVISDDVSAGTCGLPFQSFVPYFLFIYTIPEAVFSKPNVLEFVTAALAKPGGGEQRMRKVMQLFRKDVLWRVPGSRVAENALIELSLKKGQIKGIPRNGPFRDRELERHSCSVPGRRAKPKPKGQGRSPSPRGKGEKPKTATNKQGALTHAVSPLKVNKTPI